jgi:hypothetical protein
MYSLYDPFLRLHFVMITINRTVVSFTNILVSYPTKKQFFSFYLIQYNEIKISLHDKLDVERQNKLAIAQHNKLDLASHDKLNIS